MGEYNYYNSLAYKLKISVGTVRNNMNWSKGLTITNYKGENIIIYLKEKGVSYRHEQIHSQLKP